MAEKPDQTRCSVFFMQSRQSVTRKGSRYRIIYLALRYLSLSVNRRINIRKIAGVKTPPTYSSFAQKTFSSTVVAEVERITQKAPNPDANINQPSSFAPLISFLFHAITTPKKETRAVVRYIMEYIV